MANEYSDKLRQQLAAYKRTVLAGVDHRSGEDEPDASAHSLPAEAYRANILPGIRDAFWSWFEARAPRIGLHPDFHDLTSSQALVFNLFFPFVRDGRVDPRLLSVLGVAAGDYAGEFEKVLDAEENTHFDFLMEAKSGEPIFFEVRLAEDGFARGDSDARHLQKLERHYQPYLHDQVDAKWLKPETFFGNYAVMRKLSYLGRYPESGLAFIFPRANEGLKAEEQVIKQIVSKRLAPRVAILYLEYLVERILKETASDPLLHEHFLQFRAKYICVVTKA